MPRWPACVGAVCALAPAAAQAATTPQPGWALLIGAAAVGALLALAALVVAQRMRNARDLAAMRRTLTAAADCWWRTDANLAIIDIEPGDRRAAWLDPAALRGRSPWQLGSGPPSPLLQQALDARAPFFDILLEVASVDGVRTVALSGAPLLSGTGKFDGYAGVLRDLSSLAAVLAPAAAAAPGREPPLDLARRELDSLSHSISHDLRAPLRVVDGFATIVLEDYALTGRPLDDLGRDHLKRIIAAASRMNSMIDTMLTMSRMTSGELARERVDLSQLARELAAELQMQDAARPVQWTIAPQLACDGDRTLLQLVLQNLLGNAWKFSARAAAAQIEFGVDRQGPDPVYFVRDNGAGFDMRFADKMFGLFQRFHSSTEFPGTGVGLATVQRLVRKHGGRIWAESAPGQGATFFFTLWESSRAGG